MDELLLLAPFADAGVTGNGVDVGPVAADAEVDVDGLVGGGVGELCESANLGTSAVKTITSAAHNANTSLLSCFTTDSLMPRRE